MLNRTLLIPNVLITAVLLATVLSVLGGCKSPVSAPAPQPPKVTVAKPVQKDVQLFHEFTGSTDAVERAEIRARVQGFLKSAHFEDSADVSLNQLLFVIEQEPFEASLKLAQSELESQQAALKLAQVNIERGRQLIESRAISQQELDVMDAELLQAAAAISGAEAVVDEAQLQLDYTSVVSPIEGRIDRKLVDVGNLVGADGKTLLANVVRLDPIHAYFDIDERIFLGILDTRGGTRKDEKKDHPIFLARQNDQDFPFEGVIDFLDNEIDPGTGTILARGTFPNPDLKITPGMFARLRVPQKVQPNAVLVEEHAIGTDIAGKYLLVVGKENIVELRRIKLGPADGTMRVIQTGLSGEEEYIVEGLQRARPGLPVTPVRKSTSLNPSAKQSETGIETIQE